MKKIILSLCLFLVPFLVKANSVEKIDMDIYIDNNGTAHITEKWSTKSNKDTEFYKPYYNLGESKISNFKVKMGDKNFTYNDNWNVSDSFEEKKYTNGINYISNGLELCFGISKYGTNAYTLTYDISNFVVSTSDGYQMLYWTLFPYDFNIPLDRIYIKIYSDFRYSDNLDVWGYGKYGMPAYVYDGYIEIDSESKVKSDEYVTILVKFPKNTFNTNIILDKTFDDYHNMAEEGSTSYTGNKETVFDTILSIICSFFPFIIAIIAIVGAANHPKYGTYRLDFGKTKNKVKKDILYFRDIPYPKENLGRAYWIACQYNLILRPTDYLGAILLKWLKLGNIKIEKIELDKNIGTKETSNVIFNSCEKLPMLEVNLYQMMYEASEDGKLEKKEFETWCKKNYSKILKWFNDAVDSETEKLIEEEKLTREGTRKKCTVSSVMMEEAEKLAGLKKFLQNFSNIKDRSAIEVNLWEEYLMYAQIFGIAKKVMKEFKDMYPEVITEDIYNDINFIYYVSYNGMNSATTARDRANSYSSGGGGFSSGGGGGGSFGGGGGGGGSR